jgi:hypothetical protein
MERRMSDLTLKNVEMKDFFEKHIRTRWLGYTLSLLALFLLIIRLEVSFYLFLYTAGYIYAQPFLGGTWNWARKLLVAPLFSTAALILLCGLFDLVNIPIGIWCIYIAWFGALLVAARFPFSVAVHELQNYKNYWFEIVIAVIFVTGLAARVLPVIHEPAPILHDPVAHAVMAKNIIKYGEVRVFYSPGLHFTIAMATLTTTADLARNTMMITQFFNALAAVTSGIFLYEFSKRKWWALMVAGLFAVWPQHVSFYTAAGKNALVFNTAFLFLVWAVVWLEIRKTAKIILSNLLLLTSILSHYPSAFIVCLGLGVMFLLSREKKLFLSLVIFAGIAGMVWGGIKVSYQVEKLESSEYHSANRVSFSSLLKYEKINEELEKVVEEIRYLFLEEQSQILWQISMLIMVLLGIRDRKYWFLPVFWVATYLLIAVGTYFRPVSPLRLVTSTQKITQYLATYMLITFPISIALSNVLEERNKRYQFVIVAVFFIWLVSGALTVAQKYEEYQTTYRVVERSDLDAFEWMAENLDPTDRILVDARIHESRVKTVVFAGDSGVWITTYTDFETSAPFERTGHQDTYSSTKLYLDLAADPNSCRLRAKVLEGRYKYYFRGSRSVHAFAMNVTEEAFKLIYDNGKVKIYQILPCANQ